MLDTLCSPNHVIYAPPLAAVILRQVNDSYIFFRHRKAVKLSGIDCLNSRSNLFLKRQCERLQPKVHDGMTLTAGRSVRLSHLHASPPVSTRLHPPSPSPSMKFQAPLDTFLHQRTHHLRTQNLRTKPFFLQQFQRANRRSRIAQILDVFRPRPISQVAEIGAKIWSLE